jgi:hypothetical protein
MRGEQQSLVEKFQPQHTVVPMLLAPNHFVRAQSVANTGGANRTRRRACEIRVLLSIRTHRPASMRL